MSAIGKKNFDGFLGLAVSAGLLLSVVTLVTVVVVRRLGQVGYMIDDGYIHLSLARNLLQTGTWGLSPHVFCGASSSPVWTALLSLTLAAGLVPPAWIPLGLSLLSALAVLAVSTLVLRAYRIGAAATLVGLVAMVFVTPLTTLVFMGMEHALHLCLFIGFAHFAVKVLHERPSRPRTVWALAVLATLMAGTRYEGLFAVAAAALFLLIQRRWARVLLMAAAGFFPMMAFGLYALGQGGPFLPNSLLMKGDFPQASAAGLFRFIFLEQQHGFQVCTALLETVLLLAVAYFVLPSDDQSAARRRTWIVLWLTTVFLHLQFAPIQAGMQRYEAYLVGSGLLILVLISGPVAARLVTGARRALLAHPARHAPTALLVVMVALSLSEPYVGRAVALMRFVPSFCEREYDRNHMSGLFLHEFYRDRTVAVCDLGATSWYSGSRLVDLWGLGTTDVTRAYRAGSFNRAWAANYCTEHQVEIAILHSFFVEGRLQGVPAGWTLVGSWRVQTHEGPQTVCFFAVAPGSAERLAANLRMWRDRLSPRARLELGSPWAPAVARE